MTIVVGSIVEGHGELAAIPRLIHRIAYESLDPPVPVDALRPHRVRRSKLVKEGEFERALEAVWRRAGDKSRILVVVDCDDDCPAELGPQLVGRAASWRSGVPVGIVLANREFEAWFLAAAKSLRGHRSISMDFRQPESPELIRDAKALLSRAMEGSRVYKETLYQVALVSVFDIELARQADSFDKCYREIIHLLTV